PAESGTGTARYTWMRDATFMLQALNWFKLDWEADEFMQFVADVRRPRTARCRSCMALTAVAPPESETGRHLGNFPQAFFCAVIGGGRMRLDRPVEKSDPSGPSGGRAHCCPDRARYRLVSRSMPSLPRAEPS